MDVRLRLQLTGTRDGQPWPPPGTLVDLPDQEAEDLIAAGLATDPDDVDEDQDDDELEDDDEGRALEELGAF